MNKKKILAFGFLPLCLGAAAPTPYDGQANTRSIADALWNQASHEISASLFYQQAFGDNLTFFDATFLAYYATGRYYGVKAAAGFILAGPILQFSNGTTETYEDAKQVFLFNTVYADYLNEQYGIHAIAGRYKANEEWNTYYSQGFGFTFDGFKYTSLHLSASYGSAFVTNEFVTPFRTDLSDFGSYLVRATFELPYHIHLQPYVYVTGFFSAFGMSAEIAYSITKEIEMATKLHVAGYSKYYASILPVGVNRKFGLAAQAGLANQNMAGIGWLEEEMKFYDIFQVKLGLIGVTSAGAELIDYYGHKTPFEYNVGMFWSNAISVYASAGFNWNHIIEIEAAVRGSFLSGRSITSFEVKGEAEFPIWRQRNRYGQIKTYMKGKVGISAIGIYNNTPAINFYGGTNYTLIRGFFRISI